MTKEMAAALCEAGYMSLCEYFKLYKLNGWK